VRSVIRKAFVTGAAGFIGSNLVDRLLKEGCAVVGWDNFSTGQEDFVRPALKSERCALKRGDNLDLESLTNAMAGCDFVFHFAANADVRFGLEHPSKDLNQNTLATFNVLEAMRANGIARIAFASTGSVYGEATVFPTPEDAPFPVQTSLYAASKLAGEGMIQAYCEGFGFEGYIFRFVSILGERYTHGHVFDFYKQLLEHPDYLRVLGDGAQRKSYLYIQDCVSAIFHAIVRRLRRNIDRSFLISEPTSFVLSEIRSDGFVAIWVSAPSSSLPVASEGG
jgi:UDP-glucose 4-epimerase